MTTRPATEHDHSETIAWLRADDPHSDRRVFVEEDTHGDLVGAALRVPNPLHPGLDFMALALPGAASVDLVRAAADAGDNPALLRALPGTPVHTVAMAAGATVFERVPASRIDPSDPEVIRWATNHEGATRPGTDYGIESLTDMWITYYVDTHQAFGVTDDHEILRARLGDFVGNAVDPSLTRIVEADGEPVAMALAFTDGPNRMALVDSLQPSHPDARRNVEIAMAALLQTVPPEPLELDGHESGEHYPAVLATIPHVTAGTLTPMEMLKINPAC